jgi:hypothetical protein
MKIIYGDANEQEQLLLEIKSSDLHPRVINDDIGTPKHLEDLTVCLYFAEGDVDSFGDF